MMAKFLEHSILGWRKSCLPALTQLINRRRSCRGKDWNRADLIATCGSEGKSTAESDTTQAGTQTLRLRILVFKYFRDKFQQDGWFESSLKEFNFFDYQYSFFSHGDISPIINNRNYSR